MSLCALGDLCVKSFLSPVFFFRIGRCARLLCGCTGAGSTWSPPEIDIATADAWNFGLCATKSREPRQARKGATVAEGECGRPFLHFGLGPRAALAQRTPAFRFSFEFAKRVEGKGVGLTGRLGIKESTGGGGVDVDFWNQRIVLSTDMFDFAGPEMPTHFSFDDKEHPMMQKMKEMGKGGKKCREE